MKQTPHITTTPVTTVEQPAATSEPRAEFFAAAMTMSWQLAVVVLVPIIGGFELDKKLHMVPLLTITGFLFAMIGMGYIVWRQMQLFSPTAPKGQHL